MKQETLLPAPREDEVRISAPGKLFLAGEYAVLEPGRAALVTAVDQRLTLSLRPDPEAVVELWHRPSRVALLGELTKDARAPIAWASPVPDELRFAARATQLAMRLAAEEGLEAHGFHATFENDFTFELPSAESRPPKPGLGGSAAASVLAVRTACLAQHRRMPPAETLALAAAAHWIEQKGSGSGADVAASALGGMLEVKKRAMAEPAASAEELWSGPARALLANPLVEAAAIRFPGDIHLIAAWSGAPADTRALVALVKAFGQRDPALHAASIERIDNCTKSLRAALEAASRDPKDKAARDAALQAVRDAAGAMAALGEVAQAPIVTPQLEKICALASAAGAAGKPSGAGGGDCAVVFAFGSEVRDRVIESLQAAGIPAAEVGIAVR